MSKSIKNIEEVKIPKEYELVFAKELKDIKALGIYLKHKKSGARLAIISNEDENKVFSIGFRTPPEDSTGVAHIVEHTVLCGSKKYPSKDPFIELAKGSLNTFLNAMTYPDKTIYPVASCNDKDFKNLMSVYLDAVFYPNLYTNRAIFEQEGWHYELDEETGELKINGVVYNEMKGAFSSPDEVEDLRVREALYPDSPYGIESGGDPEVIPELTYENYVAFHKRFYHPSNSYIILHGNFDIEERLDFLDKEYLSDFDKIDPKSDIPLQKPVSKDFTDSYSIAESEDTKEKTFLSYNVVTGVATDTFTIGALQLLRFVLMDAPGAPVKKALIEAGIGKEISSSLSMHMFQPNFSIHATGTEADRKNEFVKIIEDTLKKIVAEGVDEKKLTSAINYSEFKYREQDAGRYPAGLLMGINMYTTWLYDDNMVFDLADVGQNFDLLRAKIGTGYFEDLIKTYLLENEHKVVFTLVPEKNKNEKFEKELKEKLAKYKASLSEEDIALLKERAEKLRAFQEEPSSEEDMEKLPTLERSDISPDIKPLKNIEKELLNSPVIWHEVNTNKIMYLRLNFDISDMSAEELQYFGILSDILGLIDTEKRGYSDYVSETLMYTGGIHTNIEVYTNNADKNKVLLNYSVSFKSLVSQADKGLPLILEMLYSSKINKESDKRIVEILRENLSGMEMDFETSGDRMSALIAKSHFSVDARMGERLSGLSYYKFVKNLAENFESEKEELYKKLNSLINKYFVKERLIISLTVDEESYDEAVDKLEEIVKEIPNGDKTGESLLCEKIKLEIDEIKASKKSGLLAKGYTASGQVQYVSRAGNFVDAGLPYTGVLNVLNVLLSYEYLWVNVRVKGGAYGCYSKFNRNGDSSFSSYRDPKLMETNEVYENMVRYLENFEADEKEVTKFVIGAVGSADIPLTPFADGERSFNAYMSEINESYIKKSRNEMINTTAADLREMAKYVKAVLDEKIMVVVGSEAKIKENADKFDEVSSLLS
ncbi:MAG: insulinase family protein [Catonella sp.]